MHPRGESIGSVGALQVAAAARTGRRRPVPAEARLAGLRRCDIEWNRPPFAGPCKTGSPLTCSPTYDRSSIRDKPGFRRRQLTLVDLLSVLWIVHPRTL